MPYHDVTPARRMSATMGASSDARASARAILTLRPASPVLGFPVTSMASEGKKKPALKGVRQRALPLGEREANLAWACARCRQIGGCRLCLPLSEVFSHLIYPASLGFCTLFPLLK
jgi:hypothetical protein